MAQSTRQRNLFAAEDFTVVYDSFKQGQFTSYDFDTIRSAMVTYIQNNYPENFNDWINSSEFVALIELVAFLGHSLSFRVDLAARENFLSTAEKRESILRIAGFLGYNPVRATPATGLLKIHSIKTTQNVYDVSGQSLKGVEVPVIDQSDPTTFQNFLIVINEVFGSTNKFGKPTSQSVISNIKHETYQVNEAGGSDVVYKFNATVNGDKRAFEIVSSAFDSAGLLTEETPTPHGGFTLVYKDDRHGIASANTGFFVGFKQGTLNFKDVNADTAVANLLVDLNSKNVNNTDIWVHSVDDEGRVIDNWAKVESTYSTSVIFNALKKSRKLYSIKTLDNENVAIQFGDGIFADVPRGVIRIWYRTSLDLSYTLNPSDVGSVKFNMDYVAADGNEYTVTFSASLEESVRTASTKESDASIKENAGRVFATQDRMISAEDYNVLPLSVSTNIKKIKSINRTHSGHSRFITPNDPTAQYQNVDIITDDGYIYTETALDRKTIALPTVLTTSQLFGKYINDLAHHPEVINLFYQNYDPVVMPNISTSGFVWSQVSANSRTSTGFITQANDVQRLGSMSSTAMQHIEVGSIVEFTDNAQSTGKINHVQVFNGGSGYSANPANTSVLITGANGSGSGATAFATVAGGVIQSVVITNAGSGYMNPINISFVDLVGSGSGAVASTTATPTMKSWARVTHLFNDGLGYDDLSGVQTGRSANGKGAVSLSKRIPDGAIISRVFKSYGIQFSPAARSAIIAQIQNKNTFGIRFDAAASEWKIVNTVDLPTNISDDFSLGNAGSTSGINADNSWIIRMHYSVSKWTVYTRKYRIVFGSEKSVRFYNQNSNTKIDVDTNKPARDTITVYGVNTDPANGIYPIGKDITFNTYRYYTEYDGYTDDHKVLISISDTNNDMFPDDPTAIKTLVGNMRIGLKNAVDHGNTHVVYDHAAVPTVKGRASLKFGWKRISETTNRIDPSISNVIDIFVLTENYDIAYRNWLVNDRRTISEPLPHSSAELKSQFKALDSKKSISDTIVYRSARYKPLFGSTADSALQAKFKVVKIPGVTLSDSQIKSKVNQAIINFFDINNWDFGETFFYTELAAYVHNQMVGILSGIVIVPLEKNSRFGDLFQVTPQPDEVFIPDIDLTSIEIVNNFTGQNLRTIE
jgi:hypothetical protein